MVRQESLGGRARNGIAILAIQKSRSVQKFCTRGIFGGKQRLNPIFLRVPPPSQEVRFEWEGGGCRKVFLRVEDQESIRWVHGMGGFKD
jgi:hypothetical protein